MDAAIAPLAGSITCQQIVLSPAAIGSYVIPLIPFSVLLPFHPAGAHVPQIGACVAAKAVTSSY